MALRQIDIYVSGDSSDLSFLDEASNLLKVEESSTGGGKQIVRVLLEVEDSEAIVDKITKRCASDESFRLVVHAVEATMPRFPPVEEEEETGEVSSADEESEQDESVTRISREELYQDVSDLVQLNSVYVVMVVLSTIVAAGGLLSNSVAVIIGAMVIAPLFGPNMGLSLATTLGDLPLARRSIVVNGVGLLTALTLSVTVGMIVPVDIGMSSIAGQTNIMLGDILLALAAGTAGALSFTQGISGALIGVMVAVALLPPLVVAGMLLGSGHPALAYQSGLLVLTNVISINLAGVATFLVQGVQPGNWWEAKKARKNTWYVLGIWIFMLAVLMLLIVYL
jgi:uncharacterized hydrophobic protein (TIGR00341 family)